MVYIKNNSTIYPLNKELRITHKVTYHLSIGDTDIVINKDNKVIKFYFEEIQRQIKEGNKLIDLNEIIGSYKLKEGD